MADVNDFIFFSEWIWNEYIIRLPVSSPYILYDGGQFDWYTKRKEIVLFYFNIVSFNVFDSIFFTLSLSLSFYLLIFLLLVQNKSIIVYCMCTMLTICASWFFGLTAHLFLSKRRRLNVKWRIRMANDFYACVQRMRS